MFIKVNASVGFNSEQVGWWKYEVPPPLPPDPPVVLEGQEGEPAAQEGVPTPDVVTEPTMTLYMTTGGECVITGDDAEKVRQYYSVPSSHLTVL